MSDLAFVLSRSPRSHSLAQDALDAAMTALLFDQSVTLYLLSDGAFCLSDSESGSRLASLAELGSLQLVAGLEDVTRRGLEASAEKLSVRLLAHSELARCLSTEAKVLSF